MTLAKRWHWLVAGVMATVALAGCGFQAGAGAGRPLGMVYAFNQADKTVSVIDPNINHGKVVQVAALGT
ncbi:MAG: hypothetical protein ACYDAG_12160, partial [Chloroflexota bacterium]